MQGWQTPCFLLKRTIATMAGADNGLRAADMRNGFFAHALVP